MFYFRKELLHYNVLYFGGLRKSASENHRFSPENIKRRMGRTVEGPSSAAAMSNTSSVCRVDRRGPL